ncbi:MAG: ketopantoate reductase family protein [Oscillospiraceae bacterium]|nr:ketopantoate reductase family protein [Oscillospiraceae bacterium]
MNILIYGAGVIGCELAHMLCKRNDVTLLARGEWKKTIDKNGLVIRHYLQMKTTVDRLKTIDVLEEDDKYDLIFVVMQAFQLTEVIPFIAKNASSHIVFVGNNMTAQETARMAITDSPMEKEIAFGFQGTAGRRENGKVISLHAGVGMTVGGFDEPLLEQFQRRLKMAFGGTGYHLTWENQMDTWLKCHAAWVLPICYVCYITDGCLPRATHRLRKAILDADLEGYRVLQKLGYSILPVGDEKWFSGLKRPIMAAIFFVIYKTPIGRLMASDHAMHAVSEMQYLDAEFETLRKKAGIPTPTWDSLRKESKINERLVRKI